MFFAIWEHLSHYLTSKIPTGVFRTQSNIHGGASLQKQLTAFSRQLLSKEGSIIDVRLGSKYTTDICRGVLFLVKFTRK